MPNRPNISAELKRKVLVEAGHRCAISTCRSLNVDIHHITPWNKCKKHEYKNLIALCPNCHRRADKNEIDKKSLLMYKNNLRFLYDKFTTFEIDILFELTRIPTNNALLIMPSFKLLLKRIIESKYIEWNETPPGIMIGGMKSNPDFIRITPSGKKFVSSLENQNIGY
jgi:hypothetical protein